MTSSAGHEREIDVSDRLLDALSLRRNLRALFVPPDTHLRPLDGLRALSILWVMLFHAAWYSATFVPLPTYVALLDAAWMVPVWRGDFGVDVFFVLSGFLIAGLLLDEQQRTGRLELARFYWRRLLRLGPALAVAAALYVAIVGHNSSMIWANLLYVSNFVPILQAAMGWTWSLAIEEQFYLLCPWLVSAMAALGTRARMGALAAIILALVAIGAYVVVSGPFHAIDSEIAVNRDFLRWAVGYDHLYVKPWMRAGPLLVGVTSAYLFRMPRFMPALAKTGWSGAAAAAVALIVAAASTHWPLASAGSRAFEVGFLAGSRTVFATAIAYLLLLSISQHRTGRRLGRLLSSRALYPIAQLAYSAYLVNPIVCIVVHGLLAPLLWPGAAAPMLVFLPLDIAGTLLVALVIHLLVERPFMALRPGERIKEPLVSVSEPEVSRRRAAFDRWLFIGAIAIASLVAWRHRFIQDDAFISFRYAYHLATGHGLVWNVGEPAVQGFTNPLWTLALALGIKIGLDPLRLSQGMGLACFVVTLATAGRLAAGLTGARRVGTAVVVALGLNASFNAYATGGLETQSQAMLVALVAWCVYRRSDGSPSAVRWAAGASTAAGLALWTRLDSALLVAPLLLPVLVEARRARSARLAVAAVLPVTALAAGLAFFSWVVFGSLLPNTFYAKTGEVDAAVLQAGVAYSVSFLTHYQLVPILGIALFLGRGALREPPALLSATIFAIVIWSIYVVAIGGDFMEYRLFVPVLPLGVVVTAWLLQSSGEKVVWAMTAASVVCSALCYFRLRNTPVLDDAGLVETVRGLDGHLTDHEQNWAEVGRGLRRALACDRDVTIGVMAAGAIPYYSNLRTVDMLGLSDPWVARHGVHFGSRAGHRRGATLAYLVSKRVNIVLHPWPRSDVEQFWTDYTRPAVVARYVPMSPVEDLPADASIIEIPIANDRKLRALYLVRDEKIDQCIAAGQWRVLSIRP